MISFKTLNVKVQDLFITLRCADKDVYRFLKEGMYCSENCFPAWPHISFDIEKVTADSQVHFPLFNESCCKKLEGYFDPPFPPDKEFVQIYRHGSDIVYRRGFLQPTTVGVWSHGSKQGKIFMVSVEPRIEEIRVAVFVLLREAMKGYGLFPLHAAALSKGRRAVVIPAQGGTGKTALSIALLQHSFSLITDDTVLLGRDAKGLKLAGFPEKPRIGKGHLKLFPDVNFQKKEAEIPGILKWHAPLDEVFFGLHCGEARPTDLVFLVRAEKPLFHSIDSSFAFHQLARHATALGSREDLKEHYLDILRELAETTRAFMVGSPSPERLASQIENLLEEA